MNTSKQIAQHFRMLHFGGNSTGANLKETLSDVTWQQATTQVYSFNTIAKLVFHIHYYVAAVLEVLQGKPLDAHDKYSFDVPSIQSKQEWEKLLNRVWTDAEAFAQLVEQLPEQQLWENLEKYGSYYKNIHGIIEHSYYHLGQITLIKKML